MTLLRRDVLASASGLAIAAIGRHSLAQSLWMAASAYPEGNYHTKNLHEFIQQVRAATGGRLQIQLHSNASLLSMPNMKRGVQTGQVQLGEILLSAYGNENPFFEVDSVPMLVTTVEDARRLAELQRPYLEALLRQQGLTLLYWAAWPPAGLCTNAAVDSLEQLRRTKMRTWNALSTRFAALIGAVPTLVHQAEVPQAFAAGIVNVMITSARTGVDVQAWDFCRFYTPIGFVRSKNAVIVRTRLFEALPDDVQAAFRAAGHAAEERAWAASVEETEASQATLVTRGMALREATPALMEGLRRVGAIQAEEWVAKAGEDGRRLMDAYNEASKQP
jgi:TRAP-type C4-dicarboxylate transport system substrate-binding protein